MYAMNLTLLVVSERIRLHIKLQMSVLRRRLKVLKTAQFLWPPCVADADIIFSSCGFFYRLSSSLFPRLISAVADWMSTNLAHMVWP